MHLRWLIIMIVISFIAVFVSAIALSFVESNSRTIQLNKRLARKYSHNAKQTAVRTPFIKILAKYPHDSDAFTQGLLVDGSGNSKTFIESTGLYGKSSLRRVDIETGNVLAQYDLSSDLFGEGVTMWDDSLIMITWKSKKGYVFNKNGDNFALNNTFGFNTVTGEGWGIDTDGNRLIVSDGSSTIMFWNPKTFKENGRIEVTYRGEPVSQLNELEFANGFIYANVWYQHVILKIDPESGAVVSVFDCSNLVQASGATQNPDAVLNGIAYDAEDDVFYLTGKLWNSVYKVRLDG
jgi:glutamine cyclotransferase